jgi:hypothetical protein
MQDRAIRITSSRYRKVHQIGGQQTSMKELTDGWIDILMILSEDSGHLSWEIAEQLGEETRQS